MHLTQFFFDLAEPFLRRLIKFYTTSKNGVYSESYSPFGMGNHYSFGNTFLTESMMYQCHFFKGRLLGSETLCGGIS